MDNFIEYYKCGGKTKTSSKPKKVKSCACGSKIKKSKASKKSTQSAKLKIAAKGMKMKGCGCGSKLYKVGGRIVEMDCNNIIKAQQGDTINRVAIMPDSLRRTPIDSTRVYSDSIRVPIDSTRVYSDSIRVPQDSVRVPQDSIRVSSDSIRVPIDSTRVSSDSIRVPQDSVSQNLKTYTFEYPRSINNALTFNPYLYQLYLHQNLMNDPIYSNVQSLGNEIQRIDLSKYVGSEDEKQADKKEQTVKKEQVIKKPTAKKGSPEIMEIQKRLKRNGYDPGPIDGIMGPKTRRALELEKQDNTIGYLNPSIQTVSVTPLVKKPTVPVVEDLNERPDLLSDEIYMPGNRSNYRLPPLEY